MDVAARVAIVPAASGWGVRMSEVMALGGRLHGLWATHGGGGRWTGSTCRPARCRDEVHRAPQRTCSWVTILRDSGRPMLRMPLRTTREARGDDRGRLTSGWRAKRRTPLRLRLLGAHTLTSPHTLYPTFGFQTSLVFATAELHGILSHPSSPD